MTPDLKRQLVKSLQPIVSRVRTDATAVKIADGTSRWTREALTDEALVRHVNGGPGRGVCPIKEGESVTMLAVLDLDSHGGETPWDEMARVALDIMDAMSLWGYQAVPFRSSGGRGLHLYVLWDEPQDAYSVRQAMADVLVSCGLKPGAKGVSHGQVEVFPKQDAVAQGELGNQFILPLAGKSEPLDVLMGLEPMGREAVIELEWPVSHPVPRLVTPVREVLAVEGVEPIEKVRSALMAIPNGADSTVDYDEWRDLAFATHEATGGSEEGREVFADWSRQNPIFDEKFFDERVWHYIKPSDKRQGCAITRGTLFAKAMGCGWASAQATPDGFVDAVPALAEGGDCSVETAELPPFERKKDGTITATIGNLVMACQRPDVCAWRIAHDRFRDEIMVAPPGVAGLSWRPFTDADYTRLRIRLEKGGFDPIGREAIRDAVYLVAQDNAFDSAIVWLNSLKWDGTPRVKDFMARYIGTEDTPYTQAASLYTWTALAGRLLDPGCQADMVPIFIGSQGLGKTSAVKAMSPAKDFFVEVNMLESDDNLSRKMRGKIIAEIGELRGLKNKEVEAVKSFISRTDEEWIPKFKEFGTKFPRRLLFIGTTNKEQFLGDDTGNRRWLPLRTGKTNISGIKRDVLQLWAEARDLWLAGGVRWQEAERLAREVHGDHEFDSDPWQNRVMTWLASPDLDGRPVRERQMLTTDMVLMEAMRMDISRVTKFDAMRAGDVLRGLGYQRAKKRLEGVPTWVYVPTLFPPQKGEVGTEFLL